jgi:hypothetical protein
MTSHDELDQAPAEERPARGCRRQATFFGLFGALTLAVFCGVCGLFGYLLFVPGIYQTPAEIAPITQEIVDVQVPDVFQPRLAMKWDNSLYAARLSMYQHQQGRGALQFTEIAVKVGDKAVAEAQLKQQMSQQDAMDEIKVLKVESSQSREFLVRGQPVKFTFEAGEDVSSSTRYHQVTGQFVGKNGPAALVLQMEDDVWDEAVVVEMLESMGRP